MKKAVLNSILIIVLPILAAAQNGRMSDTINYDDEPTPPFLQLVVYVFMGFVIFKTFFDKKK